MKFDSTDKDNLLMAKSLIPTVINQLVERNEIETLSKMKNEIVSINVKDFTKRNPLHIAAISGNRQMVEFLLSCRISVNELDDQSNTPLNYACFNKREEIARIIRNNGGILNLKNDIGDYFCKLAFEGDLITMRLLHYCGANLMLGDYDRRTAAHVAASEGRADVMDFLINEIHMNIMVIDRWGNTPYEDSTPEIKRMIEKKFHVNKSKKGSFLSKKLKRREEKKNEEPSEKITDIK